MTDIQKKTAGIAITSLVLGILGLLTIWVCVGVLFAIPAVICGHIGYARVAKSGGALSGSGVALAGLITGYLSIALVPIIGLLMAIAVPSFTNARNKSFENSCKNNLRLIEGAREQYALDNANKMTTDWSQLVGTNGYIKDQPVCKQGGVYTLPATLQEQPSCSIHGKL